MELLHQGRCPIPPLGTGHDPGGGGPALPTIGNPVQSREGALRAGLKHDGRGGHLRRGGRRGQRAGHGVVHQREQGGVAIH